MMCGDPGCTESNAAKKARRKSAATANVQDKAKNVQDTITAMTKKEIKHRLARQEVLKAKMAEDKDLVVQMSVKKAAQKKKDEDKDKADKKKADKQKKAKAAAAQKKQDEEKKEKADREAAEKGEKAAKVNRSSPRPTWCPCYSPSPWTSIFVWPLPYRHASLQAVSDCPRVRC